MSTPTEQELDQALGLDAEEQLSALTEIGRRFDDGSAAPARLGEAMAALIEQGHGTNKARVALGEALGWIGDPRLRRPSDDGYWVRVQNEDAALFVARFPVTNLEYQAFVSAGGYDDAALWGDDGSEWLAHADLKWPDRAAQDESRRFIVPNQPVVGVTFWEARAYARSVGARLPRHDERRWVMRGAERRPYPWGSPFGEGNANTQEEVVGRPAAVGLYVRDRTPEGVRDLAGNVAEWNADGLANKRWIHPGAFNQPSMAAWGKAGSVEDPDTVWASLGFRIVRDEF